jgi:hypothetical protein
MTADPGAIDAGIGLVRVLHRLALGVEPVDALTRLPTGGAVRVGRELPSLPRRFRRGSEPLDRLARRRDLALEHNGTGRFKLRHGPGLGSATDVLIRVDDPWRRYVPRRFKVPIWTFEQVTACEARPPTGPFVATRSRLLRPWLLPGSAAALPQGTTGLRGQVTRAGVPLPWPRVEVVFDDGGVSVVLGRAHGDERGEFVVVVAGDRTSVPLPLGEFDVRLVLYGPPPRKPDDPAAEGDLPADDPLVGLPLEQAVKPNNPPAGGDFDTPLLRGELLPDTYQPSTTPPPTVHLEVGRVSSGPKPFPFTP